MDCNRLLAAFYYPNQWTLVPVEGRMPLLTLPGHDQWALGNIKDFDLASHKWIRTRDGDIAYVVEDRDDDTHYTVLRVPEWRSENGTTRRLFSCADIKLLLSSDDQTRPRFAPTKISSDLFGIVNKKSRKKQAFLGGLEQVQVPKSHTMIVEAPDPQELLTFVEAQENSLKIYQWVHDSPSQNEDMGQSTHKSLRGSFGKLQTFDWLTAEILMQYADQHCSSTIDVNDRVEVREFAPTELQGASGFVVTGETDQVRVQTRDGIQFTCLRSHLRRLFYPGDAVDIVSGPHQGEAGLVVVLDRTIAHLVSDRLNPATGGDKTSNFVSRSFLLPLTHILAVGL